MLLQAFQHRSGRVISVARLVLAITFLIAIWADPSQPSRYPAEAYAVLSSYLALAAMQATATWRNWWLERKLARPMHIVDIILFAQMVFLTEGYTSPFFTFSVFIILSATIRWGPRETAATAAAVIASFLAIGFVTTYRGSASFEITRFLIRGTYLVVLSLLLTWFAFNLRRSRSGAERNAFDDGIAGPGLPIDAAIDHVAMRMGAPRVALLWWQEEEPWLRLAKSGPGAIVQERHRPDRFDNIVSADLTGSIFLFDLPARRVLVYEAGETTPRHADQPLNADLARHIECEAGIVIPVYADGISGLIVAMDVPGLCTDDARVGERVGREVSATLRRAVVLGMTEQAAVSRTRAALARDLHDSIVQLLTGTALRLEGIGKSARAGRAIEGEIEALQGDLATEQRELRSLIGQLRDETTTLDSRLLRDSLGELIRLSSRQWGIECELVRCPADLLVTAKVQHELAQLVREGIANATRHGHATMVHVLVDVEGSGLKLTIADNGTGFPVAPPTDHDGAPWSLNERVHALGGTLTLSSSAAGSSVAILLSGGQ